MTSPSAKSASASRRPDKWSLKRVVARKPEFRPLEQPDIKYLWAAYKKGGLAHVGVPFDDPGMDAAEFTDIAGRWILHTYEAAWALFAPVAGRGTIPVGVAFGFWPHPAARYMVLDRLTWFPWASARNKIEAAAAFLKEIRHEIPMLGNSRSVDKPFFEVLMRIGVINRVGTSMNVYGGGEPATIFETRGGK